MAVKGCDFDGNVRACSFCCATSIADGTLSKLQDILPAGVMYLIDSCTDNDNGMEALMHANLHTEQQVTDWLEQYEELSLNTMRVTRTIPGKTKILFNKAYHCQHQGRHGGVKNTDCPFKMILKLQRTEFTRTNGTKQKCQSRSKDPHIPEYPFTIQMKGAHNHTISSASALRYRDVDEAITQKFEDLFRCGYSPSGAYHLHQYDLLSQYKDEYYQRSGDRRYSPDKSWCYRLYYHIFQKSYGSTELQIPALRQYVDALNTEMRSATSSTGSSANPDENFIAISDSSDIPIIAICTPLMKRVHRMIKHSGELVFVDAGGNMDRQNSRVFLLLTHSASGGLPIGVLLLANEQCQTITCALQLYLSLLDNECFGGRGNRGPLVFMTDDSTAERNALKNTFPESQLLLCAFHILQAFWRFLWDSNHGVKKENRQQLFVIMKAMLYAPTQSDLEIIFNNATSNALVQQHTKVLTHLQSNYKRRSEWALCCRSELPVRGNNTNNFCESAMRVMKDKVLQRTKAFNIQQLVDFVVTRLDDHYKCRLIDVANNRFDAKRASRFLPLHTGIDLTLVRKLEDDTYEVPSERTANVTYIVNMGVGCCTCPVGTTGGPCKHQSAVIQHFNLSNSWNFLPTTDTEMRRMFYIVATGDTTVSNEWFASLIPASDAMQGVGESHRVTQTEVSQHELMEFETNPLSNLADSALLSQLDEAVNRMKNSYMSDPVSFGPPILSYCKKMLSISDSQLVSALHCFGKYTGAARAALLGRTKLVSLKTIGVQPTALARRKMPVGGRKMCHLGRPLRSAFTPEHGYSSKKPSDGGHRHVMPRRRAPHNLQMAVDNVESLGKSHSAK